MIAKSNSKGVNTIALTLLLTALNIALPSNSAAADFRCVTGKEVKTVLPGGMQEYRCMSTNADGSLVQVGSYVLKYEDGSYSVRASFKNGEPHGAWISFYRNGKINEEGAYYLGNKVGVWRKWSADGRLETLEEFQCGCASQDRNDTNLVRAIISGDTDSVRNMLSQGANPNIKSSEGMVPIMVATGSTNIISDVYATDAKNRVVENVEILELLLIHGANADYRNNVGMTPLHNAVYHGRQRSVSLLLEFGANPNELSEAGLTPLMYAGKHCLPDIAKILILGGADVNLKSPSSESAFDIASKNSCSDPEIYSGKLN